MNLMSLQCQLQVDIYSSQEFRMYLLTLTKKKMPELVTATHATNHHCHIDSSKTNIKFEFNIYPYVNLNPPSQF